MWDALDLLEELATKYTETKFVKIISTNYIPNYSYRMLPKGFLLVCRSFVEQNAHLNWHIANQFLY